MTTPTRAADGSRNRRAVTALALAIILVAGMLYAFGANPAGSQTSSVRALEADNSPGVDPTDGVWQRAPAAEVPLTSQETTYPFGGGEIATAHVRAVHHDETLYVNVQWNDAHEDDASDAYDDFADAAAVQFPSSAASTVPFFCMGQADGGVNIWQWRADSQAGVPEVVDEISSDAYVDMYPSLENLWYPARDVGNVMASESATPVQNLVAEGFGSLTATDDAVVKGEGAYADGKWSVVYARPFASPGTAQPAFSRNTEADIAVAVWDGHRGDRNGQKSVSQFTKLEISDEPVPADRSVFIVFLALAPVIAFGLAAIMIWRAT